MTSIYSTGTVSVTNGSAAVVGIGTAWVLALVEGGTLYIEAPGNPMPVALVTDDTHLTGAMKWTGATGTYNYAIALENAAAADIVDLNTTLSRILVTLSLVGIHPNDSGTIAKRNALSLGIDDEGFLFLYAEIGHEFAFYRWTGTTWDGPFSLQGPSGLGAGGYGLPAGGTTGQFLRKASATNGDANFATPAASEVSNDSGVSGAKVKDALNTLLSAISTAAAGVAKRGSVRAATTTNITIATALNNGDSLDGVSLVTGDLVLVKNQSAPADNGVYVVGVTPVRSTEFDTYNEHPGSLIAVQEGTTLADTFWFCTSNVGGTLGSTAINFSNMSVAVSIASVLGLASNMAAFLAGGTSAQLIAAMTDETGGGAGGKLMFNNQPTVQDYLNLTSVAQYYPQMAINANYAGADAGYVNFQKTRNGAPVQVGDGLGTFVAQGMNSALGWSNAGFFAFTVGGISGTSIYARMPFSAGASGTQNMVLYDGLHLGSPAGLDKGLGTLNVSAGYYVNGVMISTPGAPVNKTADFTVAIAETNLINNKGSTCVVTLPAAASFPGRQLHFCNEQAFALNSVSSNVVPKTGGVAGTAILPATDGAWATLISDGTNWKLMRSGT